MTTGARPAGVGVPAEGLARTGLTIGEFFDAVRAGHLVVQRCLGCGAPAVPPKAVCPDCYGTAWERASLGGDGEVASFTVIRVAPARLAPETPYAIVVVRMGEGVSLLGRLVDMPIDGLRVGLPVRFVPPADRTAAPPVIAFTSRVAAAAAAR